MPKLESVKSGEMRVDIWRPHSPLPEGIRNYYYGEINGRKHWHLARGPVQACNVSYEVLKDTALLWRMVDRAKGNRSGVSVRGPARAYEHGTYELGLTPQLLAGYVRSAANNASGRRVDGPITVRVKRLEEPEPYTPTCAHCKQTLDAHERVEVVRQGNHGQAYWLCPQP